MTPLPSKSDPDVFPDASRYLGSVHIEHYFRFSPENRSPSSCFLSPSSVQVKLFLSLGIVSALCRCAQNKLVGDGSSTGSDPRLLPSAPFLSLRHVVDDPLPPKKFRDLSQRAFSPRWRDHDVPSSKVCYCEKLFLLRLQLIFREYVKLILVFCYSLRARSRHSFSRLFLARLPP